MQSPIPSQRHLFDIPNDIAYFNCAYMSPLMNAVVAAGKSGVESKAHPWTLKAPDFFSMPERARGLFAMLVGASVDDIAIVGSVSYGIETAVKNIRIESGRHILLCADEFPSNLYPWRRAAQRAGAEIVMIPRPSDDNWTEAIIGAIGPETQVAVLSHCQWTDGGLVDLKAVRAALDAAGAMMVVDTTQSLGAMPFDVREIRPDFMVAAAYKWLLGPYSLGFLYVSPKFQNGEALEENWITREGAEDFANLINYRDGHAAGARRYDIGERSNFVALPMAIAALEQIIAWHPARIQQTLRLRTDAIAGATEPFGFTAAAPSLRAGHFLGLRWPGAVPADLPERLAKANVFVSIRGQSIRVTPHLYNDDNDMARLIDVLGLAARKN